jgi:hypothetical protein
MAEAALVVAEWQPQRFLGRLAGRHRFTVAEAVVDTGPLVEPERPAI